ncbi:E3 binding domain-containing protein [Streptomyces sp. SID1046]|uniref:E3 binding domain-containing protein n=1 Tax=Streptomyces sp. SID1046 TaxID=2690249 RepID=UPI001F000916|nr:E3 binding domain-containing protein [Streptomyces sp. SID1046]
MAVIDSGAEPPVPAPAPAPAKATAPTSALQAAPGHATTPTRDAVSTPLVRHLAEQKGIDPSSVHGSGKGGRITRSDVEHTPAERPHRVKASPPPVGWPCRRAST